MTLRIDGRLVATKGVDVPPGETERVTFERSFDGRGDRDITVAGTALPSITVVPSDDATATASPPAPTAALATDGPTVVAPGEIAVVATSGLADWVRAGYDASVTVTLVNPENRTVSRTVPVAVDGQRVATETVRIGPNARRNVSISFPAAEGRVTVAGVEAGTLSVGRSLGPATDGDPTSGGGPGFGAPATALALCLVILYARGSRRS